MPRIRCHYEDCVFLEEGYCGAAAVELDPDLGCQTYTRADEATADEEEEWEDELEDELWEDEEEDLYEDDEDDDWDDEQEDEY
ncbi:MAG: hypothetical protein HY023_04445 [Chloroflexi bacterium]|nr:hypothetical protein [Chloroflexota bacterium]MBI3762174.1 hypothetical protein [Chloroflexota bacterium]